MRTIILFLVFTLNLNFCFGQGYIKKEFTSIEEALDNPDSVQILNLFSKHKIIHLDSLVKFHNLEHLSIIGEFENFPDGLSEMGLKRLIIQLNNKTNNHAILTAIGKIQSLEFLSLIGELRELDLHFNLLERLTTLELRNVCLDTLNLDRIFVPRLRVLRVYYNGTDELKCSISSDAAQRFISLREIVLSECNIQSFPEDILRLPNLTLIDLSYNSIHNLPSLPCVFLNEVILSIENNKIGSLSNHLEKIDYAFPFCVYRIGNCSKILIYVDGNPICKDK